MPPLTPRAALWMCTPLTSSAVVPGVCDVWPSRGPQSKPWKLTVMLMLDVALSKMATPSPDFVLLTTGTCCAPSREMRNAVDMCCSPGWQRPIARRRHGRRDVSRANARGAQNPSVILSEADAPTRLADTAARCTIAAKHPVPAVIPCSRGKSRGLSDQPADFMQAIDPPEKNREGPMRSVARRRTTITAAKAGLMAYSGAQRPDILGMADRDVVRDHTGVADHKRVSVMAGRLGLGEIVRRESGNTWPQSGMTVTYCRALRRGRRSLPTPSSNCSTGKSKSSGSTWCFIFMCRKP